MAAGAAAEILQRLAPTSGIDGDGSQQFAQLAGAGRVERTASAAAEPGKLLESSLRHAVASLVKQEYGQAQHAQLACKIAEFVDRLLHRIAHEDERIDPPRPGFVAGVAEHAADLSAPAEAAHPRHPPREILGIAEPRCGGKLTEAAIIGQLNVEAAETGSLGEHFRLKFAGDVPGGLAAGGGI